MLQIERRVTPNWHLPCCRTGDFVAFGASDCPSGHTFSLVRIEGVRPMKVRNSLKSLRSRHRNNRLVRRKGRVYVINKTNRRFKARQG